MKDKCEWRRQLGDQCSVPPARRLLLCGSHAYEGISGPIKHSHSHRSLHAAIQLVVFAVCIRMNGITHVLILCARIFVAFVIHIRIAHKWNLSFSHGTDYDAYETSACVSPLVGYSAAKLSMT